MAHRRTYSARHLNMAKDPFENAPLSPPLAVFNTFALSTSRKPRQFWQRTTFLALFALIVISAYVLLVAQPQLSPIAFGEGEHSRPSPADRLSRLSSQAGKLAALRQKRPSATNNSYADKPQVILDPAQELAAVTGFIASLPQNVIPPSVDPTKPIDPQLILDFDTRSPSAPQEVEAFVIDTWARNPVTLYSRVRPPPLPPFSFSFVRLASPTAYLLRITDPLTRRTRTQANAS